MNSPYYYTRKVKMPFEKALTKITENLQQQGFGVITTIDVKNTLKEKRGQEFRNYKILGACNPDFAYRAISIDSHMGLMLPCNVVVQEHENGDIEVTAINPSETLNKNVVSQQIMDLAAEAGTRLRTAVDDLHRPHPGADHAEALPEPKEDNFTPFELQG